MDDGHRPPARPATPSELTALLRRSGLDWEVDAGSFARLRSFLELRNRWAETHNVGGPATRRDPWRTDVVDGVAVALALDPSLPLVDVGSGGGVPGLVIAAVWPDRAVLLVEPTAKRSAFLRTTARALGLDRVRVVRGRWPLPLPAPAQLVSRAVVAPAAWPALAVAGGDPVRAFLRMLATERPPVTVPGFVRTAVVDYRGPDAPRRVERWSRVPESPDDSPASADGRT